MLSHLVQVAHAARMRLVAGLVPQQRRRPQGYAQGKQPSCDTILVHLCRASGPGTCPEGSTYTNQLDALPTCPERGHEWQRGALNETAEVRDSVGNVLRDGDALTVIKDL